MPYPCVEDRAAEGGAVPGLLFKSRIDLSGRPLVIAGASSGIGAATALACARAGMPVVLGGRRVDRLQELAERIHRAGGRAEAFRCDVVDPEQCRALVERSVEAFGSIYAAIANAGHGFERGVLETTDQELRDLLEVNVFGSLNVVRPAGERMLEAGRGHILLTSSVLSKIGVPCYSAYSSSKAMQDHLGRALRHELRGRGIHVSTVHPIGTRTEFFDVAARASGGSLRLTGSGERFMQKPERVARAIVRCLRRPRGEVWTSWSARAGVGIATIFPGLTDLVLQRMLSARQRQRDGDATG